MLGKQLNLLNGEYVEYNVWYEELLILLVALLKLRREAKASEVKSLYSKQYIIAKLTN